MAAFRIIDLAHIANRRKEANGCLAHGYFHAATLTACSGIELLLEFLLKRLYDELLDQSKKKANALEKDLRNTEERNHSKTMYWGLNSWMQFYQKNMIFERLCKQFDYAFKTLADYSLREVNEIWNKCKHDPYSATENDANRMVLRLNEYLLETEINLEDPHHKQITFGEVSNHWLDQWELPLGNWLASNPDSPQSKVLLPLSSFLDLVIRLIDDTRLRFGQRTALMVAANYAFSSHDLLPESADKQDVNGLVDDAAVLALTLFWLLQQEQFDNTIVYSHWPAGDSIHKEVDEVQQFLFTHHESLFPDSRNHFGYRLAWKVLERIPSEGPETLWQNYWQEQYKLNI